MTVPEKLASQKPDNYTTYAAHMETVAKDKEKKDAEIKAKKEARQKEQKEKGDQMEVMGEKEKGKKKKIEGEKIDNSSKVMITVINKDMGIRTITVIKITMATKVYMPREMKWK